MWLELSLGTVFLAAILTTLAWLRARRQLLQSRLERESLEKSSHLLAEERRIMEMMGRGATLQEVLDTLTRAIESMAPECLCTVLLLDQERLHLLAGSGGSLPKEYMGAVNGLTIGPDVGACGSAASRNETVVVGDIATDYRFAMAKDFVMSFGLRACWSVPIRDSSRQVLGTFAMYHRQPAKPRDRELQLVEAGAHLAGSAIERLRAMRSLRENDERIKLAEKTASLGIWQLDFSSGTMTVSEELAAQLGLARAASRLSVEQLRELIHTEDWEALNAAVRHATEGDGSFEAEVRAALPNGSIRWLRTQGRVEFEGSRPARLNGASVDITRMHEMVIRLEQAMRAKSDFLANMSHEIRTPMNGLLGTVDLMLGLGMTPEQKEHVDTLRQCGRTLLRIVDDILDLSKIGSGKLTIEAIPFRLEGLLKEIMAVITPLAAARGLEVLHEFDPLLPDTLIGDPQRLRQVMMNLLSNAVKFTDYGSVALSVAAGECCQDSAELHFSVRDTGIGIPAGVQDAIFEPFTQADSSTTRRYGGTGLGLSICRGLIASMKGQLEVTSEPDHGSVFSFTITLPIAAEPAVEVPVVHDQFALSTRPLTILLVEDNPVNQKVAARLLDRMGHRVDVAGDGKQAVAAVQSAEYDAILMDCQMPEMDGYTATRVIRTLNEGATLPIIAMTAHAMAEDRQRCFDAGMDYYLAKPVSADSLRRLLEDIPRRHDVPRVEDDIDVSAPHVATPA